MNLEWRDVDAVNRLLTARDTKNHDTRYVPMTEEVAGELEAHRVRQTRCLGGIAQKVFINPRTRKPYVDVRKRYAKALKEAGITRPFTFHGLRHTAASHFVMSGSDLRTVGAVLGHRTPQMTQRYAHLSPGYLRAAADRLGAYYSGNSDAAAEETGHLLDTRSPTKESRPEDGSLSSLKTGS